MRYFLSQKYLKFNKRINELDRNNEANVESDIVRDTRHLRNILIKIIN